VRDCLFICTLEILSYKQYFSTNCFAILMLHNIFFAVYIRKHYWWYVLHYFTLLGNPILEVKLTCHLSLVTMTTRQP